MLFCNVYRTKVRIKFITRFDFDVCEFRISTSAKLSILNLIFLFLSRFPQTASANTTGTNSRKVMSFSISDSIQVSGQEK
jgi:hypothetical protein